MGVLDSEYTGKPVDTMSAFEEEVAKKKKEKQQAAVVRHELPAPDLKELEKDFAKGGAKQQLTKAAENSEKLKLNKDEKPNNNSSSTDSSKALLEGVNTGMQGMESGGKPPNPMASALSAGISSGGNPAAIGGALMIGLIQSSEHKMREYKMGLARAEMEKAKGEKAKGEIALKMGDAVSRAIGGSGRKRSINI